MSDLKIEDDSINVNVAAKIPEHLGKTALEGRVEEVFRNKIDSSIDGKSSAKPEGISLNNRSLLYLKKEGSGFSKLAKKLCEYVCKAFFFTSSTSVKNRSGLDPVLRSDIESSKDLVAMIANCPEIISGFSSKELEDEKTSNALCKEIKRSPEKILQYLTPAQVGNEKVKNAALEAIFENPEVAIRLLMDGKLKNEGLQKILWAVISKFTKSQVSNAAIKDSVFGNKGELNKQLLELPIVADCRMHFAARALELGVKLTR